ncbi:MAG TPA: hypothetical protein VGG25_22475 [Streptosporangiaceae bacterium]|jgi:hypothetical protein
MGLPARQRKTLDKIENKLRGSDPRLAAMFAIFGRLTAGEEIPRIEELRHRVVLFTLRARMRLTAFGGWLRGRSPRRRSRAILFPVALILMAMTVVVVARFGASPRCAASTAVATAKPQPRGRQNPKNPKTPACRPPLNPMLAGR